MRVELLYFALLREVIGASSQTRELQAGATAGQLLDQIISENPRLSAARRSLLVMVNQEYVTADHVLADGDEVALIPPVSGGEIARFLVTAEPLDPVMVERFVSSPNAGAVITFTGVVRQKAAGQEVTLLEYEAYPPAAEKMMAAVSAEIEERWPVTGVAIHHRTGPLQVGDASVVIAVSAAHRDIAYAASRYAIERLKAIVPIWKKEHYRDGATWIGSEAAYQEAFSGRPT